MALSNRTYYAPHLAPPRVEAWQVEHRPESGTYVSTSGGVLLFRVSEGMLHFWDRRNRTEVSISVENIVELAGE